MTTRSGRMKFLLTMMLGLLLFIPSVWGGFLLDDFYFLGAIEGRFPEHDTNKSLFTFFINDEAKTARIADEGGYPWWIDDRVRSQTFRPLSDMLWRLDYYVFARFAPGYHLHSLFWWMVTLFACGLLYRRLMPGAVGALAFLLFAVDDAHVMPVAWVANRNALVAVAPVLLGLWAWIRWREDGWRGGRVFAPAALAVGLAASEIALAALGYIVAYELFGAHVKGIRSRLAGLAPVAILGIGYVLVYKLLGCGGTGSGVYYHPLHDPAEYLTGAVSRVPTLLASAILGLSADLWFAAPQGRPLQVAVGCAGILFLAGLLALWRRDCDSDTMRTLRWLLPGSLLSLLPIVAGFPSDRMLLVPGIGISAALACVFVCAFRLWRARRSRLLTGICGLIALGHLVIAPIFAVWVQSLLIEQSSETLDLAASRVVRECAGKETVVIFSPDHVVGLYMPVLVDYLGEPAPKSWRPLTIARCDHLLRRTGERRLEIETGEDCAMMTSIFEQLYRSPMNSLGPGDVIDRGLFKATVMEEAKGGLIRVAFDFDRDLSDASLRFLVWIDGTLRAADLPDVGGELFIERTLGPAGF